MSERGDLEIVRACAEAMGLDVVEVPNNAPEHTIRFRYTPASNLRDYWPITDDEQAMALVRRLKLDVEAPFEGMSHWNVAHENGGSSDQDLNRAICLCVANLSRAG